MRDGQKFSGKAVYESPRLTLRHVAREDFFHIYEWRKDLASFDLLRTTAELDAELSYEEYATWLNSVFETTIILLAIDPSTGNPVGCVLASDLNFWDGWGSQTTYFVKQHRGRQIGLEASLAFWDYLFATSSLRKVYVDVADPNRGWFESMPGMQILLIPEGRFPEHVRNEGVATGLTRYAVYRERLEQLRDLLFPLLGSVEAPSSGWAKPQEIDRSISLIGSIPDPPGESLSNAASAVSPDSLLIIERFMRMRAAGDTEGATALLAAEVTYGNSITGVVQGPAAVARLLDFAWRVLKVSRDSGDVPAMEWGPPTETAGVVSVTGVTPTAEQIEHQFKLDDTGKIVGLRDIGSGSVIAAYLRGAYPFV